MHNSKRYAGRGLRALLLLAALWGMTASAVQAQQEHTETLEQATGADTINYARMQYELTAHNEQMMKQIEHQQAMARLRRNAAGLLMMGGIVFYIVRKRNANGWGAKGGGDAPNKP